MSNNREDQRELTQAQMKSIRDAHIAFAASKIPMRPTVIVPSKHTGLYNISYDKASGIEDIDRLIERLQKTKAMIENESGPDQIKIPYPQGDTK